MGNMRELWCLRFGRLITPYLLGAGGCCFR